MTRLTSTQLDAQGQAGAVTLKDLVGALPRETFQITPWRSWLSLLRCVLVIAALGSGLALLPTHTDWRALLEVPTRGALWFLMGWSFVGLFIVGHDCGHYAFSKRRWVNDVVGNLVMGCLFSCYHSWKLIHNQHHVHSNVRGKDVGWPEQMQTRQELMRASRGARLANWLTHGSPWGLLLSALVRIRLWRLASGSVPQLGTLSQRDARALRRSLTYMVLLTATVVGGLYALGGLWAVINLYAVPAFVGNTVGGILILMQHSSADALVFDPEDHTPFRSQVVGTYDTRYPRLLEWLCLDVNLHLVHHLTPRVPWYEIRRATAALKHAYPECVQERRFSLSMLWALWKLEALERRPAGYMVRVKAPQPAPEPRRRPLKLPAGLLGSRA